MRLPTFVIGGTNKAGTTSVFSYLSEHPEVCGSSKKETAFFEKDYTGDLGEDGATLDRYFAHSEEGNRVFMEASTGYLAASDLVAKRIAGLPDIPRMLFILRNPVDRLYSYFQYQKSLLLLPSDLSFEMYIKLCEQHESGAEVVRDVPFDRRHLKALAFGKYANHLKTYLEIFPAGYVKVMFFDDLRSDPSGFMKEICRFIEIREDFFDGYVFGKTNTTYFSKVAFFHKLAIYVNVKMERILRRRPDLKSKLVSMYKKLNMEKQGYDGMSSEVRGWLQEYYSGSVEELGQLIGDVIPKGWH